ncbi:MAG: T9SS type A sorting domain-containing protein [Bacteroidota bacterium]
MTGTRTIGGIGPNYPTIAAAINDLNILGVGSGGIRFLVASGHREVSANLVISMSGNSTDSIIFSKNGIGANPLITAAPGSGNKDGIILLNGADYVLFDGIDVSDTLSNNTDSTRMEWGYAVLKNTATNGSEFITLKNCTVTLQKANKSAVGIYAGNHLVSDTTTLLGAGGHTGLKIINDQISNCYTGISVIGSTLGYDSLVEISGNNISNFGGGISPAKGINVFAQNTILIQNNTINGGAMTKGSLTGIFTQTGKGTVSILNNTISLSTDSVSQVLAIHNNMGTLSSNITINQNRINSSTVAGNFTGIHNSVLSNSLFILNDSINQINIKGNGSFTGISCDAAFVNRDLFRIANNYIGQITELSVNGGTMIGIVANTNGVTIDSNTITGFYGTGAGVITNNTGIYAKCKSYTAGGVIQCSNNIISNLVGTGDITYVAGIDVDAETSNTISNRINGLRSAFVIFGIYSKQGVQNIYRNKIYDLYSSSSRDDYGDGMNNAAVTGISSYFGSRNIHNNLISKLSAPASSFGKDISGITIDAGGATNIYYNTVYLDSRVTTSTNFGTSILYVSSFTSAFTVRNNIFVNTSQTSGGGVATVYRFLDAGAMPKFSNESNNNLYYPGTPASNRYFLQGGGFAYNSFVTYKQNIGPNKDSISYTQMPSFMDTTGNSADFLRLDTAYTTFIESGAGRIANYIKDFRTDSARLAANYPLTGQINGGGTNPDMGAYEGDYKSFAPVAFSSDSTLQLTGNAYRNVARQGILGMRIITTGVVSPLRVFGFALGVGGTTNIGDISNARMYYTNSKNVLDTTRFFGSGTPNINGFSITGNMQLLTDTNYFWLTYDVASSAIPGNSIDAICDTLILSSGRFVVTNPNPAGSKVVPFPLSGTYTAGTTGSFPTLTNAINTLNLFGISGAVTLNLIDTVYNVAKGEAFPLVINAVPGSTVTDSILIKPAASVNTRIVASEPAVFILNGADNIKIDGSNNGSNSRNLTISATNGTGIWMQNTTTGDSCVSNTFRNIVINAGNIGIGCGTSSISTSSVGTKHNSNGILNCRITASIMSVYLKGSSTTVPNKNNYIIGNEILTSGVLLSFEDNIIINQNKITQITASAFGLSLGIATFSSYAPTGSMVTNARVSSNEIGPVIRANSAAIGLAVSPATLGTNIIDNNLVYGVVGSGTSTGRFTVGIYVGGGVGCTTKIYYNTVSLSGTSTRSTPSCYAIAIGGTNPVVDIKNNIFHNAQTSSSTTSNSYAIGYNSATFVGLTASNNCLFTQGANAKFAVNGGIGINTTGSIQANLAALQTSTGQHSTSLEINPDLDTAAAAFYRSRVLTVITGGVPLVNFTTDKQGNVRNAGNPSLGALELIPVIDDIGVAAIKAENNELRVVVRNYGYNFVGSLRVNYKVDNNAVVSQLFSVSLNPFDTSSVVFSPFIIPNGIHSIKVYTTAPNSNVDTIRYNDTITSPLSYPLSGIYTVGGLSPDYRTIDSAIYELGIRGVKAATTFTIRSGVYATQMYIPSITGTSDTARVTFTAEAGKADSVSIGFDASGAPDNYVVQLNNAKYITLKKLTFTATDSLYGNVIVLNNESSFNIIDSCKIVSSVASNFGSVSAGINSFALSGKYNLIQNNTIQNGNYGIQLYGFSDVPIGIFPANQNRIEGNRIQNAKSASINIIGMYNLKIRNNTVTTSPSISTTHTGIRLANCDSITEVTGNTVKFNTGGQGIYLEGCDGFTIYFGLVANNDVCLMNSSSKAGISTLSSTRLRILHNSVHIKGNGTGAAAAFIDHDYLGGAPAYLNVEMTNNVFANSGGGLSLAVPMAVAPLLSADYNNLYSTGSLITQSTLIKSGSNYFRGLGTSYPTLTSWRSASFLGLHAVSYRPGFKNDTLLEPNPLDTAAWSLSGRGIHLDSLLAGKDMKGVRRPAVPSEGVPDIGAYEFKPAAGSIPPLAKALPVIPNAGDTQIFIFAEDTVARVIWDVSAAAPMYAGIRQYTGVTPHGISAPDYVMYSFVKMETSGLGTSSNVFKMKLNFQPEWLGTITDKNTLQLASYTTTGGWVVDNLGTTDTIANVMHSTTYFSSATSMLFTGTNKLSPLPVELVFFTAQKSGNDVGLNWTTASEVNSDYFEIEKSYDNKNFNKVDYVEALGNSNQSNSYAYTDFSAFTSDKHVIYYRLKLVDKDGSFTYSNVVVVNQLETKEQAALVYPNPFADQIFTSLSLSKATVVKIRIMNLTGQEVYNEEVDGDAGNKVITVNTEKLGAGIYFLSLEYDDMIEARKIIKQ